MSADVTTIPDQPGQAGGLVCTAFVLGDQWAPASWPLYFKPEGGPEPELLGYYFDEDESLRVGIRVARQNRARFLFDFTHEIMGGGQ